MIRLAKKRGLQKENRLLSLTTGAATRENTSTAFDFLRQYRDELLQIGHDQNVGCFANWGILVGVHGNNEL
jgi:hypothetical protein